MEHSRHCNCLEKHLECTICGKLSISPTQNCANGHLVCGVCFEKVKRCRLCEEPLPLAPCNFADRLVQDMQIPCKNSDAGCELVLKSCEMIAHRFACEYRPIECFEKEKKSTNCGDKIFNLNEFTKHLTKDHKCSEGYADGQGTFRITKHREKRIKTTGKKKHAHMPAVVLKFDKKTFLLHEVHNESIVYQWITIIGGEKEAKPYNYLLKVCSDKEEPAQVVSNFTWTLPVLPVNKYHEFKSIMDSGEFASLHWKTLEKVCKDVNDNEASCLMEITIFKTA